MRKEPKPEDIALGKRIARVRVEFAEGIDHGRFAEPLGVTRQAVVNWERGHGAGRASLKKIATKYEVSFDWLATGVGDPRHIDDLERIPDTPATAVIPARKAVGVRVPVISMVSASNLRDQPGVMPQDIERWITVGDLPKGEWIALTVDGDSMDRIAPDGSTILVNRADDRLIDGRYYVFAVRRGAATFKRFRKNPDRMQPFSFNPDHPSIPVEDDLYVFGRARRVLTDI